MSEIHEIDVVRLRHFEESTEGPYPLVGQTGTLEARETKWRAAWATHFAVSDGGRVPA